MSKQLERIRVPHRFSYNVNSILDKGLIAGGRGKRWKTINSSLHTAQSFRGEFRRRRTKLFFLVAHVDWTKSCMDMVTSARSDMNEARQQRNTTGHEAEGISSGQLLMALWHTGEGQHGVDVNMVNRASVRRMVALFYEESEWSLASSPALCL